MKNKINYNQEYANTVGRFNWRNKLHARKVLKLLTPKKTDKILEIGCNRGELVEFLRNYSETVLGCDINKDAINQAKIEGLKVMPAERLQYKNDYFDKIISSHVIEHISNLSKAFKEMERVLKPEGLCALIYPFEFFRGMTSIPNALKIYGNPLMSRKMHLHKLSPKKIAALTKMIIIDKGFFYGPYPTYYTLLKKLR